MRASISDLTKLAIVFACLASLVSPLRAAEEILSFGALIEVQTDGSIIVNETIKVRAEGKQIKRGIYRDLPNVRRVWINGRKQSAIRLRSVSSDATGTAYFVERSSGNIRIYAGERNQFLKTGIYSYNFSYRMLDQVGEFDGHDEIYWNVTGNAWAFPINRIGVRVVTPAGATPLGQVGYTGKTGDKGTDYKIVKVAGDSVDFGTTRQLLPGEGLTIAVKWPKGFISKPAGLTWQTFASRIDEGLQTLLIASGILPLYFFLAWVLVGRGSKAGVIIPRYEPPANLSPAAISYAHYMRLKSVGRGVSRALIAALVSLAVKQRIGLGRGVGYMTIRLLDRKLDDLPPGERAIIDGFFRNGDRLSLSMSNAEQYVAARKSFRRAFLDEYEGAFFKENLIYLVVGVCIAAVGVMAMLFKHRFEMVEFVFTGASAGAAVLVGLGYSRFDGLSWSGHSFGATGMIVAGALVLLLVGWFAVAIDPVLLVPGLAVFVLIGTIVLAAYLLRAPTLAGRKLMDQIDGFKMYLSAAETERLNMSHPPEMSIRHFEKFLPYAIALGIERQWSDIFASQSAHLLADQWPSTYRPNWIAGGEWSAEGVGDAVEEMVSSMSDYTSGITPTLMERVTSSGSGSGGGGSSGGGGGGGGGGGW